MKILFHLIGLIGLILLLVSLLPNIEHKNDLLIGGIILFLIYIMSMMLMVIIKSTRKKWLFIPLILFVIGIILIGVVSNNKNIDEDLLKTGISLILLSIISIFIFVVIESSNKAVSPF